MREEMPAGFSTFRRVFMMVFKTHLHFRAKGEHHECDLCNHLKKRMREAPNREERTAIYKRYSAHLLAQWLDRQVYWAERALSQQWFASMTVGARSLG
jgi:hypothetical protein